MQKTSKILKCVPCKIKSGFTTENKILKWKEFLQEKTKLPGVEKYNFVYIRIKNKCLHAYKNVKVDGFKYYVFYSDTLFRNHFKRMEYELKSWILHNDCIMTTFIRRCKKRSKKYQKVLYTLKWRKIFHRKRGYVEDITMTISICN